MMKYIGKVIFGSGLSFLLVWLSSIVKEPIFQAICFMAALFIIFFMCTRARINNSNAAQQTENVSKEKLSYPNLSGYLIKHSFEVELKSGVNGTYDEKNRIFTLK